MAALAAPLKRGRENWKGLAQRAQCGTNPDHQRRTYTSKLEKTIFGSSLRSCLGQGASLGEEAVLADSGREGEITVRDGWVRSLAFLSILRVILLLS